MNIKPLGDRVLIKRWEEEEMTQGGIYIPDSAKEKPAKGEVVALGSGKVANKTGKEVEKSFEVKVGDLVLFSKFAGTELSFDGCTYLILRESDITAVIE